MKKLLMALVAGIVLASPALVVAQQGGQDYSAAKNANWNHISPHHWFKYVTVRDRLDVPAGGLKLGGVIVTTSNTVPEGVTETSSVATNVALSRAVITATCAPATYTTNIITYLNATTNAVASTNVIPATWTVTVVNGTLVVTNVTASLSSLAFVSGIATNAP